MPRVIGQTAEAERKKPAGLRDAKQWDEATFFERLTQKWGPDEGGAARAILDWAKRRSLRLWWGRGSVDGSFFPILDWKGNGYTIVGVWTFGRVQVQFKELKKQPPFDSDIKRNELRERLNQVPGIDIGADKINVYPSIPLATLASDGSLERFLEALDWCLQEIKATSG